MQEPIGIFDSGVGGTSIWQEIKTMMPNENTIYLADSKNAPYGVRSQQEIVDLSFKNTELLLAKGCKIVVVACNTATTNAIGLLRETFNVPFIGIEPAIKPAALNSKTKKVGVLATKGTLSSSLFQNTSKLYASGIEVIERKGDGLVGLIEAGKVNSPETKALLKSYIKPMLQAGIDSLVLGCTHYPYLTPLLKDLLPSEINIIDSGFAVAKQTMAILDKNGFLSKTEIPMYHFYSNSNIEILSNFVQGENVTVEFLDF